MEKLNFIQCTQIYKRAIGDMEAGRASGCYGQWLLWSVAAMASHFDSALTKARGTIQSKIRLPSCCFLTSHLPEAKLSLIHSGKGV